MIRTQGLTHIHLIVSNVQTSLKFYCDVFGMQERLWDGPSMVFINTPGSNDLFTLQQGEVGDTVGPGGVAHFGFQLADNQDLEAAIHDATNNGGSLIKRGEFKSGAPFAYVADPDGYVIEL